MAGQNGTQVRVGPGRLYVAPLGSPEPDEPDDAWPSAWREVGFTDEGSTFTLGREAEDVEVEESFLPVRTTTIKHTGKIGFAAAQTNAANMRMILAAKASQVTATPGGNIKVNPPAPGDEEQVMVGWQSDEEDELWIFRQCFATGESELRNRKNADGKRVYPVEFNVENPGSGIEPWDQLLDASLVS